MDNICRMLFSKRDEKYAAFQAKLTPNIAADSFIGVRIPELRKIAKSLNGTPEAVAFLSKLPHKYYDENILHGLLVAEIKDFDKCISETEKFLPYIDNWAVCDTFSPKIFGKYKSELLFYIEKWHLSECTYTCRFALEMLMKHFLDDSFRPEYMKIPLSVHSEEYYVNMMLAWFYATALAKQWDSTIEILENRKLSAWVHNKTIQKACESYRISDCKKKYLRSMKY